MSREALIARFLPIALAIIAAGVFIAAFGINAAPCITRCMSSGNSYAFCVAKCLAEGD